MQSDFEFSIKTHVKTFPSKVFVLFANRHKLIKQLFQAFCTFYFFPHAYGPVFFFVCVMLILIQIPFFFFILQTFFLHFCHFSVVFFSPIKQSSCCIFHVNSELLFHRKVRLLTFSSAPRVKSSAVFYLHHS